MRKFWIVVCLLIPGLVGAGGPILPGFCDQVVPPPPDAQEPNDAMATATPISPSNTLPVPQSFHNDNDADWFFFHAFPFAVTGDVYTVRVLAPDASAQPVGTFMSFTPPFEGPGLFFRFFNSAGTQINVLDGIDQGCFDPSPGTFFEYDLTFTAEDDYFVQVSQCRNENLNIGGMGNDKSQYCIPANAGYQMQIFQPVGAESGVLSGNVTDSVSGAPVGSAILGTNNLAFTTYSNPGSGQYQSNVTIINGGTATVLAPGYQPVNVQFDIAQGQTTACNVQLTPEGAGTPDLQVNGPVVNPVLAASSSPITLAANARNLGDAAAGASNLRFYLSSDPVITTGDMEVAVQPVAGLPAGGQSGQMIAISSPATAGTFFAGACIDPVAGESNSGNNCFGAAPLIISNDVVFANSFESPLNNKRRLDLTNSKGAPADCVVL